MNNLYVNTIKKYLYIYIVLIIEPYSCVTDDILCVWTFGLPGLYNVIKIIIIIIIIARKEGGAWERTPNAQCLKNTQ